VRVNPWMLAGVAAPPVYLAAVVAGGWMTEGYSHVRAPISVLNMVGAPAAWLLDPLFTLYNALMIVFAVGLRTAFRERSVTIGLLAPTLLAFTGLVGIVMGFYPTDPLGAPMTSTGTMHAWLAGVASVATMLAVLRVGLKLRAEPEWRRFAGYSLTTLVVIVASGALAAVLAARMSPVMGLWERVTIGAFEQWVLVTALMLVRRG